jgi:hypothetical protein
MRGRRPAGPEYVANLAGSTQAKERLQVILETVAGRLRVQDACRLLGISEPRFHQLRSQALEAGLASLEPRPAGRPARLVTADQEQVRDLQAQVADLEVDLQAAQIRTEVALALPQVVQPAAAPEKKTRQRRSRPRGREPTSRKRT